MKPPRLLAITPPAGPVDPTVISAWREAGALEAGIVVLLREPGVAPAALMDPGGRLAAFAVACRSAGIPLLVACDPAEIHDGIAMVGAGALCGLQVRGDPDPALLERARPLLGDALLGRSCHGAPDSGARAPVDYTCFAPVFTPRTQPHERQKIGAGLDALRRWTADPAAWIVALGGIEPGNAAACLDAGARGLAGISLFFGPSQQLTQDVAALVRAL